MSYKKSGKKNVITHTCNKINKDGKCRFAIDLSELKKPSSKTSLYFLICKDQNKGYLVPSDIVKKFSKYFTGDGSHFPLAIDPNINRIEYYGVHQDISMYRKSGKTEIKSRINSYGRPSLPNDIKQLPNSHTNLSKFDREQLDIIEEIQKRTKGKTKKYKGAVVAEIIINHLRKYVPNNYVIVGYNYFIQDIHEEIDAMIVTKSSKIVSKIYKPDDIQAILEIKMSGFFNQDKADGMLLFFKKIQNRYRNIKSILISARIKDYKQIRKFSNAFILSNWSWDISKYIGSWKKLVDLIVGL
ncbi:hypothetical protein ES705_08879 [subsurface metagenome]